MTKNEVAPLADVLALHPLLPMAWRAGWTAGRFLRDERPTSLTVDTKSSSTDAEAIKKQNSVMMRLRKRPASRSSRSVSAAATIPSVSGIVSFTSPSHHGNAVVPQSAIKIRA